LAFILEMQPKTMSEALKIPFTTFNRRRDKDRFTMKESDRLYSLIETVSRATDVFEGEHSASVEWMSKKAPGHVGRRPSDMLDCHANTEAVLELITRLEYGVCS